MIGVFGIFFALIMLMYLAYRGTNVLFLAPIMAIVACLFHPGTPLLGTYTQIFMPALGQYLLQYFPIFALGSIFGKMMNDSGAAYSIAKFISQKLGSKNAVLAVILACGLLTYGGVSLFVVAFTIYPIALPLFREAGFPRRLIPAAIASGSFTFTMTALPGTPAIQNAIPMPVFGTDSFAAPVLGIIAGLIMFLLGLFWLNRRANAAKMAGEVDDDIASVPTVIPEKFPNLFLAVLPLLLVVILNFVFSNYLLSGMDASFLAEEKYGAIALPKVLGLWSLIAALVASLVIGVAIFWKYFGNFQKTLNEGTFGSMLPILNTASEVGFGAVIASLAAFQLVQDAVLKIAPGNPLVSMSVAINALAGITGSASGGLSIALKALGTKYVEMATATGVPMEVMHRVASIACSGLDALPHNGAVITLLAICGLTHKKSYFDIFMVAMVPTVTANIVIVILASFFGVRF